MDQRTEEAVAVIANDPSIQRCALHKRFLNKWRCKWRTVDRIVARARAELLVRLGRSKETFRSESLAFYEAKARDKEASVSDQIRARERIDKLLGLDAPTRSELSGPDGEPVEISAQLDPESIQLLSDDHIKGIFDRWNASRQQNEPIIRLSDPQRGPEPSQA